MSKTIKEAVSKLSQDMDYLELHTENRKLRHRITKLEEEIKLLNLVLAQFVPDPQKALETALGDEDE